MPTDNSNANQIELLQGTLDMLILRTLQWGPQHGHGVGQAIRHSSADLLKIERGSLYPALHRLEGQGVIASPWKGPGMNPRGQVLPADRGGQEAATGRAVQVEFAGENHQPRDAAGVGGRNAIRILAARAARRRPG